MEIPRSFFLVRVRNNKFEETLRFKEKLARSIFLSPLPYSSSQSVKSSECRSALVDYSAGKKITNIGSNKGEEEARQNSRQDGQVRGEREREEGNITRGIELGRLG